MVAWLLLGAQEWNLTVLLMIKTISLHGVFLTPPNSPWILSCVYGPPNKRDRRAFWDAFASIGEGFEASRLCIGDFNSVLD
jgi:hypothetical protein